LRLTAFIGVDLAWKVDGKYSGAALLAGDRAGATLTAIADGLCSLDAVVDFVRRQAVGTAVVAVDCSLVVKNPTGQRPCETALSRRFGAYGAARTRRTSDGRTPRADRGWSRRWGATGSGTEALRRPPRVSRGGGCSRSTRTRQ